ncbi:MAG: SMP-30/gluconolactonase/LRE family protein [Acidobacteriota bacterium]
MKRVLLSALLLLVTGCGGSTPPAEEQAPAAPAASAVERLDPALDSIIAADATLEVLKDDYFGFTEGPVWIREGDSGYIVFSDIAANVIYKWTPDRQLSVFLDKSGYSGTDVNNVGAQQNNGRLAIVMIGSNGLDLDPQGRLVICAQADRSIVRLEKDGTRTTLADRYEGKRFNSPNDIAVKSNGSIYFTDQSSGLRNRDANPSKELDYHGVFLVKTDGTVILLDKDPQGSAPNGIGLSPDEKYLYVNSARKIVRYDIGADDTVTNKQVFIDLSEDKRPGSTDGMKVDTKGNVYQSGPGGIWIISPEGKHLGTILLPLVTNLGFGDPDGKGLYITNRHGLYMIRVITPGVLPGPKS